MGACILASFHTALFIPCNHGHYVRRVSYRNDHVKEVQTRNGILDGILCNALKALRWM